MDQPIPKFDIFFKTNEDFSSFIILLLKMNIPFVSAFYSDGIKELTVVSDSNARLAIDLLMNSDYEYLIKRRSTIKENKDNK